MTLKKPVCKRPIHCCLKATRRPLKVSLRQEALLKISPTVGCRQQEGQLCDRGINKHRLSSAIRAGGPEVVDRLLVDSLEPPKLPKHLGVLGKMWRLQAGPCADGRGPQSVPPSHSSPRRAKLPAGLACLGPGAATQPQKPLPRGLFGGTCHVVSRADACPGPEASSEEWRGCGGGGVPGACSSGLPVHFHLFPDCGPLWQGRGVGG